MDRREVEEAKERMSLGGQRGKPGVKGAPVPAHLSRDGRSAHVVAKKLGVTHSTVTKAKKLEEYPDLREKVTNALAALALIEEKSFCLGENGIQAERLDQVVTELRKVWSDRLIAKWTGLSKSTIDRVPKLSSPVPNGTGELTQAAVTTRTTGADKKDYAPRASDRTGAGRGARSPQLFTDP
jgi:hypothetical protein